MYFGMKKRCFHCGTEMKLHRKGYVDDAKEAAKNLIHKRKFKE